jgi:hypothetical protein
MCVGAEHPLLALGTAAMPGEQVFSTPIVEFLKPTFEFSNPTFEFFEPTLEF